MSLLQIGKQVLVYPPGSVCIQPNLIHCKISYQGIQVTTRSGYTGYQAHSHPALLSEMVRLQRGDNRIDIWQEDKWQVTRDDGWRMTPQIILQFPQDTLREMHSWPISLFALRMTTSRALFWSSSVLILIRVYHTKLLLDVFACPIVQTIPYYLRLLSKVTTITWLDFKSMNLSSPSLDERSCHQSSWQIWTLQ